MTRPALGHYRAGREGSINEHVVELVAARIIDLLERRWLATELERLYGGVHHCRSLAVIATELRALADRLDPPGEAWEVAA
jgi:hypothetical protein